MQIGKFTLVNEEKVNRAIFGTITREGQLSGGVGENATPEAILAAYDRLGGLVLSGANKVKMGSFYDFDKKCPRPEPKVLLEFRDIEGNVVELDEDEPIPVEVRAAQVAKASKKKVKKG